MGWFITGNRRGLVFGVSDSGLPRCHGSGTHTLEHSERHGFGINTDQHRRIQQAECSWSIVTSSESELNIDGNADGLFSKVQQSPDKSHGMIKFYAASPELVGFSIVVSESAFAHIRRIFELALISESNQYMIHVGFLCFRVPHAKTETPTCDEFIDGKPYFFDEISVSLRSVENEA